VQYRLSDAHKAQGSDLQNNKNVCKYCGFIGKKAQSLMAHMRGCAKYNATLKKEKPENNEI